MSDEIQTTDTGGGTPAVVETTPAAEAPKPSLSDTMDRIGREILSREPVRGSDGKFQPKVVAQGAPDGAGVPGSPQAAPPDPQPVVIEAPQSLPADVREKWGALPPEVQKYWAGREGELHKKFTTDGERIKSLSAYEEVLSPYQERVKQVGATPTEYVRRLAEADKLLSSDPRAGIVEVARMYGIDLRSAFQPGAQPDPNSALARELSQVKSQLSDLTKGAETAKLSAAQQVIDDFRKDKPHFDAVEPDIVQLMESGMAKNLSEAYAKALKLNDGVSAKIEAEAKAAAEKKAADEAKEKAAKDAKLAPHARRPGATPTAPLKGKTMWDTMDRVGREVIGRTD
jgi:hypothetical protein